MQLFSALFNIHAVTVSLVSREHDNSNILKLNIPARRLKLLDVVDRQLEVVVSGLGNSIPVRCPAMST